jgi:hypothetical protein
VRRKRARAMSDLTASLHAKACLGRLSLSPGDCLDTRSGSCIRGVCSHPVAWAAPPPSPALTGEAMPRSQAYCIGRYEGTQSFLGRSAEPPRGSARATKVATEPQYVFGAATWVGTRIQKASQDPRPTDDCAGIHTAETKFEKSAPRGSLSLDKKRPSMWPHLSRSFSCLPHRMRSESLWTARRERVPRPGLA